MITNQIEVSAVLVTIEGLNANLKKPGVAMYIAMHSQNAEYKMEQFVVRKASRSQVARGPQGQEADVGARAGQRQHREGHPRQGRASRTATTPSTSSTWASTSTR